MEVRPGKAFILVCAISLLAAGEAQAAGYQAVWSRSAGGWVRASAIALDGSHLASGSTDTYVYLYSSMGELLWRRRARSFPNDLSLSHDGGYLAVASDDSNVYFYDGNGTLLWSHSLGSRGATHVSLSSYNGYTAASSAWPDNKLYYYSREGVLLWSDRLSGDVTALATSSNGSRVVAGTLYGYVTCHNRDGRLLWSLRLNSPVTGLAISSDSAYTAVSNAYGDVYLLNSYGTELWRNRIQGKALGIFFVLNNTMVDVVSEDGSSYLYTLDGALQEIRSLGQSMSSISLSADAAYAAVAPEKPGMNLTLLHYTMPVETRVVLVANTIDLELARAFIAFLSEMGFDVKVTDASGFEGYREEGRIVVLGGPDAPEGTGEIVREALTEVEEESVRAEGSAVMLVKKDLWAKGQSIVILAGSDRYGTRLAQERNREKVLSVLRS